jgi:hypothetical protein
VDSLLRVKPNSAASKGGGLRFYEGTYSYKARIWRQHPVNETGAGEGIVLPVELMPYVHANVRPPELSLGYERRPAALAAQSLFQARPQIKGIHMETIADER